MSILHVNQIKTHILKIFRDLIDQSDLTTATKEERENHLLTRALAAYSLQYIAQIDAESVARLFAISRFANLTRKYQLRAFSDGSPTTGAKASRACST